MVDYLSFHRSLTAELHAIKDRVRSLVRHWGMDGEYKEAALRTVLRRHLPESFLVGRGFIVYPDTPSTQVDVLIIDGTKPTLFRDGDLFFVTPDCVAAVIEVKTALNDSTEIHECVAKLCAVGRQCSEVTAQKPWTGIFSYESRIKNTDQILNAVAEGAAKAGSLLNCCAFGKDIFVRYWSEVELEQGEVETDVLGPRYRCYRLENLASSYFVGNIIDAISGLHRGGNSYAWFPLNEGKFVHMTDERCV